MGINIFFGIGMVLLRELILVAVVIKPYKTPDSCGVLIESFSYIFS